MVARLSLLLLLCAVFAPTSTTFLDALLELADVLHTEYESYDYDATETPTEVEYDDENLDWLYQFFEVTDECDPNPCQNNGTCESKGDSFKCTCPAPFKGKKCQTVHNYCRKIKCGNGECVIKSTPPYYECKCKAPYKPPTCRISAGCSQNPCLNGGTCVKGRTRSSFRCECPADYTGRFCQIGPGDCYEKDGSLYEGLVSQTELGEECLHWNSHLILEKAVDSFSEYHEDRRLGEHNYCRNPDGDVRPWCFIKEKGKLVWDHCNVRKCTGSSTDTAPTPPAIDDVTGGPLDPSKPTPTEPAEFATCGKPQASRFTPRIYGGKKSVPGAHPWQVSLQVQPHSLTTNFSHMCGGTLIHPCWVLTAAHCIAPQVQMRVVLGRVDLLKDELSTQILEVEQAIVHENYKETDFAVHNDIALLKLKAVNGQCARETRFVRTACLPEGPFPDGTECTISGWGATPKSDFSRQLLDAKVLLISQQRCSAEASYGNRLDDSMFCAGNMKGGVDSCQGDSGGPLMCQQDGTHFLYGVVSWGDSCGKRNKPGIYTRLTKFRDWINSKIQA